MQSYKASLGVDTGGTFTDFVYYDGHTIQIKKVLSNAEAPEKSVLAGCALLPLDLSSLEMVHGSTIATNAVLEGKGVKTLFVTNRGFADMLTIGRQARSELYQLQPLTKKPPVASEMCVEVDARLDALGNVISDLSEQDIDRIQQAINQTKPEAIAINFLFSFVNNVHEIQIKNKLPKELFISCSSEVLAEYREYERGIATWLNAWVGPLVKQYLLRLQAQLKPKSLSIMQSTGGTIGVEQAGDYAVNLLLSGPAGGLLGAQYMAALSGMKRLMTLDMGGTSTDVALIDQEIRLSSAGRIADYPVAVPMVDMHTIGAGGGSIAKIDSGGLLKVGPASAGARPGPACYQLGGVEATVTDANLVLGRLRANDFLDGKMALNLSAAEQAIAVIADKLNIGIAKAAKGIIDIANEHMIQALRLISVEKGFDPKEFTLVPFGGAGGLHVCALARSLGMKTILIPRYAGVLSALGMIVSPHTRESSHTLMQVMSGVSLGEIHARFSALKHKSLQSFEKDNIDIASLTIGYSVDLRYLGQSYYLNIKWLDWNADAVKNTEASRSDLVQKFHQAHRQRYGHRLDQPVELVNLRVHLQTKAKDIKLEPILTDQTHNIELQSSDVQATTKVLRREYMKVGEQVQGPFILLESVATSYIEQGWVARLDQHGNLILQNL